MKKQIADSTVLDVVTLWVCAFALGIIFAAMVIAGYETRHSITFVMGLR